jgi:adenine-specific DNA-methyltransferase
MPTPDAVRRALGVFYTPAYVVDYIVRNTLGKLLEGKTPRQAASLRVLDPACGAGAFLVGVYRHLLDWHRDWYLAHGPGDRRRGSAPPLCRSPAGAWCLIAAEKRRILTGSVYGVDVDPRAVEASQRALLATMREGESHEARAAPPGRFSRRALSELDANVRCGNAIVGPDLCDDSPLLGLDGQRARRVPGFDWRAEFAHVLAGDGGGFDAIVGNPPYRRELGSKGLLDEIAATRFGREHQSPRMDLWYYFLHRGLELLRPNGVLSFIVSAYWIAGSGAEKLIGALRRHAHVEEVFLLGRLKVFPKVSGQHMILRVRKGTSRDPTTVKTVPPEARGTAEALLSFGAAPLCFRKTADQLFVGGRIDLQPPSDGLLGKIERWATLSALGRVRQGIAENPPSITRRTNEAHGSRWRVGEGVFALRREELRALRLPRKEARLLRPYHDLCDVGRHQLASEPSLTLIYSTRETCPDLARCPAIGEHLGRFRRIMEARRETRTGANRWWHLHWPRDERIWRSAKIVSVQMGARPAFALARQPAYFPFSMNVFVPFDDTPEDLGYLCGLLNSRLLWKWYQHRAKRRGIGLEINGRVLGATPIRRIDFGRRSERACHDRMVGLVERMASLKRESAAARGKRARMAIERRVETVDRQIDRLVYALYDLTEEEIAVVEEATSSAVVVE